MTRRPELRELNLPQRMALRVRLTAALELRDEGLPEQDAAGHESQTALKERLLAATRDFFFIADDVAANEMIDHSRRRLGDIADIENPTVRRRFSCIADALDRFRHTYCSDDPASARHCRSEIEDLFELVNCHALAQYRKAAAGFPEPDVWLEFGSRHEDETADLLDTSAFSGATRTADEGPLNVSIVTLGLRDHGLDWRSLCHLPYLFMHELVCHAYQGVATSGRTAVDHTCPWSEGWMDALAAVEIEGWLTGRQKKPDWVELNIPAIKHGTSELHFRRYQRQTALRPYILAQRVSARDGFHRLYLAFRGADVRPDRALARAARFSLRLNLEVMAQADRSKLLERVVSGLDNFFGLRRSDLVAACARYADEGDLTRFHTLLTSVEG